VPAVSDSSRAREGRELEISSASSGNWSSTSSEEKPLRMSQDPYPKWPVFKRSVVAAFQRSLTETPLRHAIKDVAKNAATL
jgi:hypothetical protein